MVAHTITLPFFSFSIRKYFISLKSKFEARPDLESMRWWASRLGLPHFRLTLTLLGLCIFTFTIITYYVQFATVGIAIAVMGLLLERNRMRVPFPLWLYAAFVLWALVAAFASPYPDMALDQVVERLKLLVIMLVAVNAIRTEGQLRFYLLFFLGCFVLFPVRGTLVGGDTVMGRSVWNYVYNNPNDLAALSLIALGVAIALYMSEPSRTLMKLIAGISALLLLVVILLTQSRGAFIGLVVATMPALLKMLVKQSRQFIGVGIVVALIIGLTVPASVWERLSSIEKLTSMETIAEADPEGSAKARAETQKVAWQIFRDHPIFGVGLGVYPFANARYAPNVGAKDTHNTYLNLAAETGLPGLILWCALVGSVLRYAYRSRQYAQSSQLVTQQLWIKRAFVGYLVAGIFGSFAAHNFPYLILAVLWCSATLLASASPCPASRAETGAL